VAQSLQDQLSEIVYLAPLREYPERHYILSGNIPAEVGKTGKNTPDVLFTNRAITRRLNRWLDRFDVGYQIQAKSVSDEDVEDVFALRWLDLQHETSVSALDVGFGLSQVLPILVQGLLGRGKVVCVEQPEIHRRELERQCTDGVQRKSQTLQSRCPQRQPGAMGEEVSRRLKKHD